MSDEKKLGLIFLIWMAPLIFILLVGYESFFQPISIDWLNLIPSFDAYVNGTRFNLLANLVWTYFWLSIPLVFGVLIYFCNDINLGKMKSIKGIVSIVMLSMAIWLSVFHHIEAYIVDEKGFGIWQRLYRESELGVVFLAFVIFGFLCISLLAFLQWVLWIIKK